MFAKKFRLPSSVFFQGRTFNSEYYTLKKKENNLGYNRYGFVVSKKIDKRAVVRNRTKRVVRACFEDLNSSIKTGYDFLIILKKQSVDKEKQKIFDQIRSDLVKNELL